MENISVEIILFIVLGSVFIIDFALKGIKKSSKKKEGILKFKESLTNNPSSFISKYLQYFIERPRNTLYILTTLFTKVSYIIIYPKTYTIIKPQNLVLENGQQLKLINNIYCLAIKPLYKKTMIYE